MTFNFIFYVLFDYLYLKERLINISDNHVSIYFSHCVDFSDILELRYIFHLVLNYMFQFIISINKRDLSIFLIVVFGLLFLFQ